MHTKETTPYPDFLDMDTNQLPQLSEKQLQYNILPNKNMQMQMSNCYYYLCGWG